MRAGGACLCWRRTARRQLELVRDATRSCSATTAPQGRAAPSRQPGAASRPRGRGAPRLEPPGRHRGRLRRRRRASAFDESELERAALELAEEGAGVARAAGLAATAAIAAATYEGTWHSILSAADDTAPRSSPSARAASRRSSSLLLGSVSHGVAQHAHVPVLIVPPPRAGPGVGSSSEARARTELDPSRRPECSTRGQDDARSGRSRSLRRKPIRRRQPGHGPGRAWRRSRPYRAASTGPRARRRRARAGRPVACQPAEARRRRCGARKTRYVQPW